MLIPCEHKHVAVYVTSVKGTSPLQLKALHIQNVRNCQSMATSYIFELIQVVPL